MRWSIVKRTVPLATKQMLNLLYLTVSLHKLSSLFGTTVVEPNSATTDRNDVYS